MPYPMLRFGIESAMKFRKCITVYLSFIALFVFASCGHGSIRSTSFYGGKRLIYPSPYKHKHKGWIGEDYLIVYEGSLSLRGIKLVVRENFDVYLNDQYYGNMKDVRRLEITTDGRLLFDGVEKNKGPSIN